MPIEVVTKMHSVEETAKLFGVSKQTMYRIINRGELPAVKVGKRIVVPDSAIAAFIESNRVASVVC